MAVYQASDPPPKDYTRWLLYPFFAAGAVTSLSGQPKTAAKTTFVLSILAGMQEGSHFWTPTAKAVVRSPVMYITEETPQVFEQNLQGARAHVDGIYIESLLSKEMYDLTWPQKLERIEWEGLKHGCEYYVIDTLTEALGLTGDEENHLLNPHLKPLRAFAQKYNFAVLVAQHTAKDNKPWDSVVSAGRGSISCAGAVDIVAAIYNYHVDARFAYRGIKLAGRYGNLDPFRVKYSNNRYLYAGPWDPLAEKRKKQD